MKRMSMQQLADKVEWEGGVADAIDYGIKHDQVPSELEVEWLQAELLVEQLHPLVEKIADKLGLDG